MAAALDHPLLTRKENRVIDLNALPLSGVRASLLEALSAVRDPRKKRGIRQQIAATLAMVAAAGLSGCGRSFRSVGDFMADLPQEALPGWEPAGTRCAAATSPRMRRRSAVTCG
jgi:hypothetical protein